MLNISEFKEDFIFTKNSHRKNGGKYSYISNEEDSEDLDKRYYELARSLDVWEKDIKNGKSKINKLKE